MTTKSIHIKIDRTYSDKTELTEAQQRALFGGTSEETDEDGKKKNGGFNESMSPDLRAYIETMHEELGVGYNTISQHKRKQSKEDDES